MMARERRTIFSGLLVALACALTCRQPRDVLENVRIAPTDDLYTVRFVRTVQPNGDLDDRLRFTTTNGSIVDEYRFHHMSSVAALRKLETARVLTRDYDQVLVEYDPGEWGTRGLSQVVDLYVFSFAGMSRETPKFEVILHERIEYEFASATEHETEKYEYVIGENEVLLRDRDRHVEKTYVWDEKGRVSIAIRSNVSSIGQ